MRKTILMMGIAVLTGGLVLVACTNIETVESKTGHASTAVDSVAQVKRGEYLVSIVGCDDCHSPKKMGAHGPEVIPELRLSGYPANRPVHKVDSNVIKQGWALMGSDLTSAVGPWGMSFAANITSDATGIGNWQEENFLRAMKQGKFKGLEGSRDLLPPMPWFIYKNMTDEDVKAIFAYLKTVKPVDNIVPRPVQLSELK